MSLVTHNIMNNSICTLFDNILIDIHKFKSLHCNYILFYIFWGFNCKLGKHRRIISHTYNVS